MKWVEFYNKSHNRCWANEGEWIKYIGHTKTEQIAQTTSNSYMAADKEVVDTNESIEIELVADKVEKIKWIKA